MLEWEIFFVQTGSLGHYMLSLHWYTAVDSPSLSTHNLI